MKQFFGTEAVFVNILKKKYHTKIDAAAIQTGGFADAEVLVW